MSKISNHAGAKSLKVNPGNDGKDSTHLSTKETPVPEKKRGINGLFRVIPPS